MKFSALRNVAVLRASAVALTTAVAVSLLGTAASAVPEKPSKITSVTKEGRTWHLRVYSEAMAQEITVDVQRPVDESQPAPNLWMLNGLDGGLGTASWKAQTDALDFLSTKQVNVIQPIGGFASYYADWKQADPKLGLNKWTTFFTEELPPLLDEQLGSTGLNSLAGLSTSGTSVLQLAEAKPGLWKSVAAYSGCAQIADPLGKQFVKFSVETWGGGDTENMYGPDNDPAWAANDPVLNAEKLRGTQLYVFSGSGIPMIQDVQYYLNSAPGINGAVNLTLGVLIEGAVNACTANLKTKLDSLGIPATFNFNAVGTHYWPYWEQALHESWPMLANGMNIPA
ncbi:alpha/beta hydrolase [Nocardia huaxiensis]|uniref:Esterase family protein n=1 Tax=Nocardia huaxiensis TaxID=2755382 RepID=A0A7D6V7L8_9NOCA|nr:alpha/beta hydrolase family protein [Nocardia huaxiensis]QLY27602.1 esterase family protein [Nocardia huaxiensis]UFS99017.1 esterase family protein [Nocardia huaxiensis]